MILGIGTCLLLLLTINSSIITGAKILLAPFILTSHVDEIQHIGEGLVANGHDVYMLLSRSYPTPLKDKINKLHIKIIQYHTPEKDMYSLTPAERDEMFDKLQSLFVLDSFREDVIRVGAVCRNLASDTKMFEELHLLKFDFVIVDAFLGGKCQVLIPHKLKVPFAALITGYEMWSVRNPALPSFVPMVCGAGYSEKMTFWERLDNLWTTVRWTVKPGVPNIESGFIQAYAPELSHMSFHDLASHASLWLIDTHIALDYPRPAMQTEVMIGGLTTKPAKPLPDDLNLFMTSARHGAIVVSFGSTAANLAPEIVEKLMDAFTKVKQHVIWRYPHNPPEGIPTHIKLLEWLPQNDLLGHQNTKLFITHCGANGQFEALYHGVPMIGFPLFAEQFYNAKRMEYKNYGIPLNSKQFTSEELVSTINEVITDEKYRKSVEMGSELYKDQPMDAMEKSTYWIEHVLKFGGSHLQSYAIHLTWYEYWMVDILLFVVLSSASIWWIFYRILRLVINRCTNSSNKVKTN